MKSFLEKLLISSRKNNSLLCVGLDPDFQRMPEFIIRGENPLFKFGKEIVDSTSDLVCAYKLNLAFYEAAGSAGFTALKELIDYIPYEIPVILDAKRGDIANTAKMYARTSYEVFGADATTLNPYMGFDSASPFLEYKGKCAFILCLSSNPGAMDFQYLKSDKLYFYQHIAYKTVEWNQEGNCGLIVGATHPHQIKNLRKIAPELPFLVPGVGTQGGNLKAAVSFGTNSKGELLIISVSRSIIYASKKKDFAYATRDAARKLQDKINYFRKRC